MCDGRCLVVTSTLTIRFCLRNGGLSALQTFMGGFRLTLILTAHYDHLVIFEQIRGVRGQGRACALLETCWLPARARGSRPVPAPYPQ